MEFDKDFNPGTGNSFNEWNIQHVENLNPNATTVTTIHNHYGKEHPTGGSKKLEEEQKQAIMEDILEYASRLSEKVKPDWKSHYADLWKNILDIPEVDETIYRPGRQKNTSFNRNLVGNIITMLMGTVYEGNATDLTRVLEGTDKHSIRGEIGTKPSEEIQKAVLKLMA